jgi:hypothetical protein
MEAVYRANANVVGGAVPPPQPVPALPPPQQQQQQQQPPTPVAPPSIPTPANLPPQPLPRQVSPAVPPAEAAAPSATALAPLPATLLPPAAEAVVDLPDEARPAAAAQPALQRSPAAASSDQTATDVPAQPQMTAEVAEQAAARQAVSSVAADADRAAEGVRPSRPEGSLDAAQCGAAVTGRSSVDDSALEQDGVAAPAELLPATFPIVATPSAE